MIKLVKFNELKVNAGFILKLSNTDNFCVKVSKNSFWCKTHGNVIMSSVKGLVEADDSQIKPRWKLW